MHQSLSSVDGHHGWTLDGNTSRLWHHQLSLYIAAALGLRDHEEQNAGKRSEQNASAKREARGSGATQQRSRATSK